MANNNIYDTTGKLLKSRPSKQKTGQDARRFRQLLKWLRDGTATLTIAGQVLTKEELEGLLTALDDLHDADSKAKRRSDEQRRRSKRVKG